MQGLRDLLERSQWNRGLHPLRDRTEAGQSLAEELMAYADRDDVLVLGLPRGGVPVAFEIARALRAPLDLFMVRKLGVPGHEELAMGAIASGGARVLNRDVVWSWGIDDGTIEEVAAVERVELARREKAYRGERPPLSVQDKIVILVDDGIATGATMRAAIAALQSQPLAKLIVAVGVAPPETCAILEAEADELVCLLKPDLFWAVGYWFSDFSPTSDDEVRALLKQAKTMLTAVEPEPEKAK